MYVLRYTGTLELNLRSMPSPAKSASKCNLDMLPDVSSADKSRQQPKLISLFSQKRARGFWPCYRRNGQGRELTVAYYVSQHDT